jgi:hypothetical protein
MREINSRKKYRKKSLVRARQTRYDESDAGQLQ